MNIKPTKAVSDWLITFGETYGLLYAFMIASFLEATLLPITIDLLMFSFFMTGKTSLKRLVIAGGVASFTGTLIYWLGGVYGGQDSLNNILSFFSVSTETQSRIEELWIENWVLAIVISGLTALPDVVTAYMAGASDTPVLLVLPLIFAVAIVRFAIIGGIIYVSNIFLDRLSMNTKQSITGLSLLASLIISIIAIGFMII